MIAFLSRINSLFNIFVPISKPMLSSPDVVIGTVSVPFTENGQQFCCSAHDGKHEHGIQHGTGIRNSDGSTCLVLPHVAASPQ